MFNFGFNQMSNLIIKKIYIYFVRNFQLGSILNNAVLWGPSYMDTKTYIH